MARVMHGMTGTSLYSKWHIMKYRGKVCKEWRNNFKAFYDWAMANGYQEGMYLNRIDASKGFSPENCIIEARSGSVNSSRRSRKLTFNGETHTVTEWADKLGMKRITLYKRLDHGWSVEKALTAQLDARKRNHIRSEKQ